MFGYLCINLHTALTALTYNRLNGLMRLHNNSAIVFYGDFLYIEATCNVLKP